MSVVYRLTRTWPDPRMQKLAEWTAMMLAAAEPTAGRIGCSPAAIVAQAALESAWGARKVGENNLFGIKATPDWTGARVLVHTREVINGQSVMIDDWFRDYPSPEASIEDHFRFLHENKRYERAGVFNAADDRAYFLALQRAGYATDPNYANALMAVTDTVKAFARGMTRMADSAAAAIQAPPPRLLMAGCSGEDVTRLQAALKGRGIDVLIDGIFGQATHLAVMTFQRTQGLEVDGIVGPATRKALGL